MTRDMNSGPAAKPNFANLKLIVYSMLAGVTLFVVVALYAVETRQFEVQQDLGPIFAGIVIGLSVLAYLVIRVVTRRLVMAAQSGEANAKGAALQAFVWLTIIQAAAVDSVSMFAATFYLVTGSLGFLAVPLAGSYLLARLARVDQRFEQFGGRRGGLIESD